MSQIGSNLQLSQLHPLRPSYNDQLENSFQTTCLKQGIICLKAVGLEKKIFQTQFLSFSSFSHPQFCRTVTNLALQKSKLVQSAVLVL